ncbi:uncharacterized protein [Choristoneura fumiferana]|uniref:uncharacterized protein n=1 Tax=Choristoneura fumiferana TaxID=7141 RepID=UPI003D15E119
MSNDFVNMAPFISVNIKDNNYDALVDTGASVSVISENLVNKLRLNVVSMSSMPLRAVGGNQIPVKGSCTLTGLIDKNKEQEQLKKLLVHYRDTFSFAASELGCYEDTLVEITTMDEDPVHKAPYRVSPKQREIIDQQGARYFADLDMNSGYWQLKLGAGKEKTAFVTHTGLYEFNVLPFGLKTSQAVFQRVMDKVLAGIKYKKAIVKSPCWATKCPQKELDRIEKK